MIKKAFRSVRNLLINKPLCTIGTVLSIKDAALGLGFILAPYEITQTLLYQGISVLLPTAVFGWFLLIVALLTAGFALTNRTKIARTGLDFMALFWLFAMFVYFLSSAPFWMIVAMVFSFLPGYVSFYCKYEELWDGQRRVWFAR